MIIINSGLPYSGYLWVARTIGRIARAQGTEPNHKFAHDGNLMDELGDALKRNGLFIINTNEWHEDLEGVVAQNWQRVHVVQTARDPREIVVDVMQVENLEFDAAVRNVQQEIVNFFRTYSAVDSNVVIYEQLVKEPEKIVTALMNALEMPTQPKNAGRIASASARMHNDAYTVDGADLNDTTAYHDAKIDVTGLSGRWRSAFDDETQRSLEIAMTPYLKKLPYKLAFAE